MKTIKMLTLLALFIGFSSCSNDDDPVEPGQDNIAFEGSFNRIFEVEGNQQRATYTISQDKISYELAGGFAATNYDMERLYFSAEDNRWVGYRESNNAYYVIFFKNISDTEITLYKKEVASLEAGIAEAFPSADNTDNYGWNLYQKISGTVENLHAPQGGEQGNPAGPFTKFNFSTGEETTSDTDWDIAFRGTIIIVNGGASTGLTDEPDRTGEGAVYIATGTLGSVTSVNTSLLVQDSANELAIATGSGNGWYNYTGAPNHLIIPIAGKVLVIKTHDGKYAKVEILSYYKDGNTDSDSRYYTFNYVYQPNEETNF
ncbi:MAG: HmuY family protein [Aestuariibaculum sp.]